MPELLEGFAHSVLNSSDAIPECMNWGSPSVNGWPVVNKAIFVPVALEEGVTVYQLGYGTGSSAPGSIDLGIYDLFGTRIVSTGLFAPAAASGWKLQDIADTFLTAGYYYMAMCTSSTSNFCTSQIANNLFLQTFGVREMLSACPLPATATFANLTSNYFPFIGLHFKALV